MRFVDRANGSPPAALKSARAQDAYARAGRHFFAKNARARQTLFRFNVNVYGAPAVRTALADLFLNKCAFCESAIGDRQMGDVYHFRPMQGAVDPRSGEVSRGHYWWLAYDWENLYWACATCSTAAGARFPVDGRRARIEARGPQLSEERCLLLDPCRAEDNPDLSLLFDEFGYVAATEARGQATIDTFDLNRVELVEQRHAAVHAARSAMQRGQPSSHLLHATRPYSAAVRQCLAQSAQTGLGITSLSERQRQPQAVEVGALAPPLLIRRIEIRNFRAIQELDLELPPRTDSGPWTVLLGENGAGKTSVLQAVALALMGANERSRVALTPSDALHKGARQGSISVEVSGSLAPRRIEFARDGERFQATGDDTPAVIAAYGAHRPLGDTNANKYPTRPRIRNLFDPQVRLADAQTWLLGCRGDTFDAAARALKRLLLEDDAVLRRERGKIHFKRRTGANFALGELSDGYRSMIGLAADLMSFLVARWGSLEAAEGVVVIDELSTHLHPRWQMRIVQAFREAFPRLQFLVTTHDPLCLRGLRGGEVIVLRQSRKGLVSAIADLPDVSGMMVDQLLTSEHFGLSSTIDPELERTFEEYYDLLAERERDAHAASRLEDLRAVLAERRQMGFTRREQLALEAADEFLAHEPDVADAQQRREMEAETRNRIRTIWAQHEL